MNKQQANKRNIKHIHTHVYRVSAEWERLSREEARRLDNTVR